MAQFNNINNSKYDANNSSGSRESHGNDRFRNYMNKNTTGVSRRSSDSYFINPAKDYTDSSGVPSSHIFAYKPPVNTVENSPCEFQTVGFPQQTACPYPNMMPPLRQVYQQYQNAPPCFDPTSSFHLSQPPPFPPPALSIPAFCPTPRFEPPRFPNFPSAVDTFHNKLETFGEEDNSKSIGNWLKNWKPQRKVIQKKTINTNKLTISEYKSKLVTFMVQLKELEKLATHLQVMSKSLDNVEWLARKTEVENQKRIVQDSINNLSNVPESEILSLLKKRSQKRNRLKKKREEHKMMKKENKALNQLEHSRIDMWLEKMAEQAERARREEDIKKQADFVLSEVFHKKSEAKRILGLLTNMGKLRNARIKDREDKKEFVSKEAAASFNTIIENLKKRWLIQIKGYNLEEQGLRVMLSDEEVKRSNVEKLLNKQIYQQWLNIMFGDNLKHNSYQPSNVEDLIRVRKQWDQFIIEENSSSLGSRIPIGWILPTCPSNEVWTTLLKK